MKFQFNFTNDYANFYGFNSSHLWKFYCYSWCVIIAPLTFARNVSKYERALALRLLFTHVPVIERTFGCVLDCCGKSQSTLSYVRISACVLLTLLLKTKNKRNKKINKELYICLKIKEMCKEERNKPG